MNSKTASKGLGVVARIINIKTSGVVRALSVDIIVAFSSVTRS